MANDQVKPPIILLGNVRSGTSLTRLLFDQHPDLCTWREPRTVWTYAAPGRRHDRFDERDARPRVIRYVRRCFLDHQREHGDRRVMEKTPSNVMRIPYIRAIFPEASLIYIKRDPFANLGSSEEKWQKTMTRRRFKRRLRETPVWQWRHYALRMFGDHFRKHVLRKKYHTVWGVRYPGVYEDAARMHATEVMARQWVACCRQADEDIAALPEGEILRVTYEQLIREPVPTFTAMLRHAGLDMTPEIEAFVLDTIDTSRGRKWRNLPADVLRRCVPIFDEEMRRQGYDVPDDVRALINGEISDEQWNAGLKDVASAA